MNTKGEKWVSILLNMEQASADLTGTHKQQHKEGEPTDAWPNRGLLTKNTETIS